MSSTFALAFKALIGNEGAYSNHPDDRGGETMWGITAYVARNHGYQGEMRHLPIETAMQIARQEYWDRYHCDEFDPRIAFEIFDSAYNGGFPVKWLQLSLSVKPDGIIGPLTLTAAKSANAVTVVARFNAYRLSYYTSLKAWPSFGRGWANRIAHNLLLGAQ